MTWGEIAKDAVRRRGYLYFSEVLDQLNKELRSVSYEAIGASCAERLLSSHLRLPEGEQQPFTVGCRRPLDCIWSVLASGPESPGLSEEIRQWLNAFYTGPLNHDEGQDGPNDADHDPAAASIYAAESLISHSPQAAGYAMSRVIDHAFSCAATARETTGPGKGNIDEFIADCCHPITQQELHWLMTIFTYAKSRPLLPATITQLRRYATS
jgi:hypothetical protein